jgi:hypothetical protein
MNTKPSEAPPPAAKKSAWVVWSVRVGVVSAAIGLLTALLGLPDKIAAALWGDDLASPADLEARTALEAAKPRLDVRYIFLWRSPLSARQPAEGEDTARANAARNFLALPVVQTEAEGDPDDSPLEIPDTAAAYDNLPYTAYLLVRNVGGRAASDVTLQADRLPLSAAVPVREAAVGGDDYAAVLRQRADSTARIRVQVPQTLAPGDGILIPLFRSTAPGGGGSRWWVISPIALLPDSLTFVDAVLGSPTSLPVRRMVNPMVIADGVVARG